ncbi:MAG: L,D-transpeptidase [Minisyncoccia bacterium]
MKIFGKTILISILFQPLFCFNLNTAEKIIRVDFSKMILRVENNGKIEAEFKVALPRKNPNLPVKGKVQKIILNPTWYPTEPTREYYLKTKKTELPKIIPPGHPLNALGIGAIDIDFESKNINPLVKIHGTNDPASIGQKITRGCIRLKNEDFLKLKNLISGYKVFVIFE